MVVVVVVVGGRWNVRWTLVLVFATVNCFPPFVLRALVGVPSPPAAVLRTLPFCALPGAVFRAILGGIMVEEERV